MLEGVQCLVSRTFGPSYRDLLRNNGNYRNEWLKFVQRIIVCFRVELDEKNDLRTPASSQID